MEVITNGWNRKCKDSLGGIQKLYIFPYVKYNRSQIEVNGNILVSFPDTVIYEFYTNTNSSSEKQTDDAGGKFYEQNLSFTLQYAVENVEKLINKDFRIITLDRNGVYKIYGLYNGLEGQTLNYNTGGAKTELNGYNLSFTGREENGAYYINDLSDAGFGVDAIYRITEAGEFRQLQNDDLRIIQ